MKNFRNVDFFSLIMMNVNWLSKNAELFKTEWIELNAVDIILKTAKEHDDCKLAAYMAFF